MPKTIPESVWADARKASREWVGTGGNEKRWNSRISRCQTNHFPSLSWKEVRDAFELERDELYASLPHEDDDWWEQQASNDSLAQEIDQ